MPLVASVMVSVEADSDDAAFIAAVNKIGEMDIWNPACHDLEINEWDVHEIVVEGNVYHGAINEAEIEED
jgi:hypothetical protein